MNLCIPRQARRWMLVAASVTAGCCATSFLPHSMAAQNQVRYDRFDFEILQTEHFDLYFYPEEEAAARQAGRMAERWYARISRLFQHELRGRQIIIYYASHPHFQQTKTLGGQPGEGTGGATEAFKRRIVLPFAGPLAETDHVLGHELVHAFQFDMTSRDSGDGVTLANFPQVLRLPLWFVEGMAEYVSVGPSDPHTTMWIRDAAEQDRLPTMRQLNDPRFFPYRFGQAFWAYIAGRFGDPVVGRILNAAARTGSAERGLQQVLGIPVDSLNAAWREEIRIALDGVRGDTKDASVYGTSLLNRATSGGILNSSPALSPDGSRVVFLSERDLTSIDMFVADATTGEVQTKLVEVATDKHLESIQFIKSAGAWDPTGTKFVFGGVVEADPVLRIVDASNGRVEREKRFRDIGEIYSPTWSPDGDAIAFSAIVGGFTDLFLYDLRLDSLSRLTADPYADLHPAWSPDGQTIAFTTDRFGTDLSRLSYGNLELALYRVLDREIVKAPSVPRAKNINPQWSPDSKSLYFLSNRRGITNVFRADIEADEVYQVTNLYIGASGITGTSPALSSATQTNKIAVGIYEKSAYAIYTIDNPLVLQGTRIVR